MPNRELSREQLERFRANFPQRNTIGRDAGGTSVQGYSNEVWLVGQDREPVVLFWTFDRGATRSVLGLAFRPGIAYPESYREKLEELGIIEGRKGENVKDKYDNFKDKYGKDQDYI